ncbi:MULTISPECIES: LLM class flavin-dependent oxidoreductase [unclassified Mycolicibacterium]|uniref:LLM class flavin-dependent oxidoreductase n=1 Tax=unclassified Mycolicibacterium TaxID=2636767 RepID=UPI002ED7FBEB
MKFGVLYDFRNPPHSNWFTPWTDFYRRAYEHMAAVEEMGFDAISLAEHHGDPDGYNPGITATLAAAAARTSRIRIGTNIIQMPFHHPVLLAEELAVIDILSNGRLDVGLGQVGQTFDMEFGMFGLNPRNRPSLLDEGLDVVLRALTEDEPFDHHGKRYDLKGVWINPKPQQRPLPIWVVAAFSEKAMDRVARRGLDVGAAGGYFLGLTGGESWHNWLGGWRAACVRNGRNPNYSRINTFGTCFVTDDPERAWHKHREGLLHSFNYERQGVRPYAEMMMDTIPQVPEDIPGWQHIFKTPEQAIAELSEVYGNGDAPDELHLMATKAGLGWDESAEYLQNFAEKVIPAVAHL